MKIPSINVVLIRKSALSLKVTIPGTAPTKYKYKNLEETINPKLWDKKAGMVKPAHPDSTHINRLIFEEKAALLEQFKADHRQGVAFTAEHISNRLKGIAYDTKNFYEFCEQQIELKNYKASTRKNYRGEISKMKKYCPVLMFSDITFQWLQGYEAYMRGPKINNESNTVWKSLKFVNTFIIQAMNIGGIITKNPFKEYNRGKYKQGIPLYLEWAEVQQLHAAIRDKPMSDYNRLVGYYTLLSYYSGLRFGDAVSFDYKSKVIHDASGMRLVLYAAKNGEIVSIAFNKYIAEVVEYIKDKPLKATNKEFNAALEVVREVAEIRKEITSHTARHSFAMRCAELGISIERTQKLMGHIQVKSTAIYYRVKNLSLDGDMKKWE